MHGGHLMTPKYAIKEDNEEKKPALLLEMSVCSLLLLGCWSPDGAALHHCLLYVILVPFSFRSPVSRYTPWLHGLGFLTDCFHQVSITLGLALSLLHYRGTVTEYEPDYFWLPSPISDCNMNPVRKWPPSSASQSRETGTDRLGPHSHSRLSLHQSLATMSSVSTRWFTWLLIISSHVATD